MRKGNVMFANMMFGELVGSVSTPKILFDGKQRINEKGKLHIQRF